MICNTAAISSITVQAKNSSTSFIVPGTMEMLPNHGRRVVASFNKLTENWKYSVSVHIHYSGGVEQDSLPVNISMCSYDTLMLIL